MNRCLAIAFAAAALCAGSNALARVGSSNAEDSSVARDGRTAPRTEPAGQSSSEKPPPTRPIDESSIVAIPDDVALAARLALERGLHFLAQRQHANEDGSLSDPDAQFHTPVPVTALAALAFMSGGSQPERGPYGAEVARAVDYLCNHCDLSEGSERLGYIASDGDRLSRMHGHGFATLALSQAYSMSPRTPRGERTANVLRAAVARIQKSQGLEGGWFYEPAFTSQHENSVTIALVEALRGAFNSGIQVPPEIIRHAVDYVRKCQNGDGSFRYGLDSNEKSTLALTAASLATLDAMGEYDSPAVTRGVQNLWRALEAREEQGGASDSQFLCYERISVAEALWQQRDPRLFARWAAKEFARLVRSQAADGSWSDAQFGACYATATNCMVLAFPLELLPIHQR